MVTKKAKSVKKPRIYKIPKIRPFAEGTMTSAAFFSMIRAALRNKSRFWPSIKICRERSREKYIGTNKRRKWSYRCEECGKLFDIKGVSVHHKIDCGSLNKFEDIPGFIERLFCDSQSLSLLCNTCHDKHTKSEKYDRQTVD